ncbi:MAG TPA: M56 family metallopeptidase [Rhizomicrobium sp.]|nr:M56 family metallopeptidase [Rhizomicrobium sp.]
MSFLFEHLWQSTLFAGAIGLLTLVFRNNSAALRYSLWFAASLKFLLPFSVLLAFGDFLFHRMTPVDAAAPVFHAMVKVAQFLPEPRVTILMPEAPQLHLTEILLAAWAIGFVALSTLWLIRWARLNAVVRSSRPVPMSASLPVRASTASLEPGLVGIWRPVLLIPEDVLARLTPHEMQAIEAHERCHLARRDNLTAAIHMLIANMFWFHPLMWWLGARLVEERERACDEAVLNAGSDPQTYAGSILKVCAFYTQSKLLCAAGVSGADLKQRIETIMTNKPTLRLSLAKKSLLTAVAVTALAGPVLFGVASSSAAASSPQLVQERLAEQKKPRKETAIDPAQFDRFVGYYRISASDIFVVSRSGNRYLIGTIGQRPDQVYPESATKFFLKGLTLPAQFSFTVDASGHATEMVLHQSGEEQHAPRIADAEGKAAEVSLAKRIADNKPSPGTETALRHQIDGLMSGHPDYNIMAPNLAAGTRQMLTDLHAKVAAWGPVVSIKFTGVSKGGLDTYDVTCRNKRSQWQIGPLTTDGKISTIFFGEV